MRRSTRVEWAALVGLVIDQYVGERDRLSLQNTKSLEHVGLQPKLARKVRSRRLSEGSRSSGICWSYTSGSTLLSP